MRRNRLFVSCLALAIFLSAGLKDARSTESEEAKQVTCSGKVVDEQGRPVYYPALELLDSAGEDRGGPHFTHFTDSGNRFSLEPGSYRLTVSKKGFMPHTETMTIEPGQGQLTKTVILPPE